MYTALLYKKGSKSPKTLHTGDYTACLQAIQQAGNDPANRGAKTELKWQPPATEVGDVLQWLEDEAGK